MMSESRKTEPRDDRLSRRRAIGGIAIACGGLAIASTSAWAGADEEISHTAESIHQEKFFNASRKRVYEALTDAKQFEQVVQLSDAAKTKIRPGAPSAQISPEVGGTFLTFGGLIEGRQIELVPGVRIVQAWRPVYWKPGVYSIVKFDLAESGSGTNLVLDHRGFPDGDAKNLRDGWNENYWEPLTKFLA